MPIFCRHWLRWGTKSSCSDSFDRAQYRDFADLNLRLIEHVQAFQPDVIFCVLMSYEVWLETLDVIRSRSPAAVVNWGTDDSWKFSQFSRYLAKHIDLHVTTHAPSMSEAAKFGINNMMVSQWAASSSRLAEPLPSRACDYDVSFVGAAYGNRRARVKAMARRGIDVTCFGHGWEHGPVGSKDVDRIYRSSRISLNFADFRTATVGDRSFAQPADQGAHFRSARRRRLSSKRRERAAVGVFSCRCRADHLLRRRRSGAKNQLLPDSSRRA